MDDKTPKIFLVKLISATSNEQPAGKKIEKGYLIQCLNHHFPEKFHSKLCKVQSRRSSNVHDDGDSKFTNGLYGLLVLAIMILSPFSVTVIPTHNILIYPEYWYENLVSASSGILFVAPGVINEINFVLNRCIKKRAINAIIDLIITKKIAQTLAIFLMHLIWSEILGYYEPVPFRQFLSINFSNMIFAARIWFLIPKELRINVEFRTKCKAFLWHVIWALLVPIQLIAISNTLKKVSSDFEWMAALIFPFTKEINDRILVAQITKCSSPENLVKAKFIVKLLMNIAYSFYYAIALAGNATKATEYVLLGINFVIDMRLCYKVIQMQRKIFAGNDESGKVQNLKTEVLTELILNEFVEVAVPIAFIGSFSMAYYGPNKNNLGAIGCTIWHHKKVDDLGAFLEPVVEMALIDFISVVIAGVSLWWYCRINLWKMYCKVIKDYWTYMVYWGGTTISVVSIM